MFGSHDELSDLMIDANSKIWCKNGSATIAIKKLLHGEGWLVLE